jgi:TonB family protein
VGDYPVEALTRHQEGTVGFSLDIDKQGNVTRCRVSSSSGAPVLDEATCALIRKRAHFTPARDANGHAAAGVFASRAKWVFPDIETRSTPKPIELRDSMRDKNGSSTIYVNSDGIITKCTPTESPYSNVLPLPDACGAYPVGTRYGPPTTFHGKPIGRKVSITINVHDINVK